MLAGLSRQVGKADLVKYLWEVTGLPRREGSKVVSLLLAEICSSLKKGMTVRLTPFGTLASIRKEGKLKVIFRPGKAFKGPPGAESPPLPAQQHQSGGNRR